MEQDVSKLAHRRFENSLNVPNSVLEPERSAHLFRQAAGFSILREAQRVRVAANLAIIVFEIVQHETATVTG
jgi:hypothetical protein